MKQLQSTAEAQGKTVKEIRFAGDDDDIVGILFTDDTILVIEAEAEWTHEEAYCWLDVMTTEPRHHTDANKLGFMSDEECQRISEESRLAAELREEQEDMYTLSRLKAKYPDKFKTMQSGDK